MNHVEHLVLASTNTEVNEISVKNSVEAYRENPQIDSSRVDVIQQLRANMKQLNDLQGRMSFMLREVKSLIR